MDSFQSDNLSSEEVDLGLGTGLRPRSLPTATPSLSRNPSSPDATELFSWSYNDSNVTSEVEKQARLEKTAVRSRMSDLLGRISDKLRLKKADLKSEQESDISAPPWNSGDSVMALGTSLRQQRILYEQKLGDIQRRQKIECKPVFKPVEESRAVSEDCRTEVRHLLNRLAASQLEVEMLRQDLETYESKLSSKEKAIHILKQQSRVSSSCGTLRNSEDDAKSKTEALIKELNSVQFELEHRKNSLHLSQQVWIDRFNSVSQENVELKRVLERQSIVIKQLYAEKLVLCRERDELLTLVNTHSLQDPLSSFRHEASDMSVTTDINLNTCPKMSDEEVGEMAMVKLEILGSCMCSASTCQCALVAAQLAQDLNRLANELEEAKSKKSVSMVACDAYRIAFEEQLNCNQLLLKKLVDAKLLSKNNKKRGSRTAEDSNITQVLSQVIPQRSGSLPTTSVTKSASDEEEVLLSLVEMITDRSEALAHQRLATNLLAERTQHLEGQLTRHHLDHAAFQRQVPLPGDVKLDSPSESLADIYHDAAEEDIS